MLVVLVVSAVGAGSALAKDPYSVNTWGQYKYCPYENPEVTDCIAGITAGGGKGGSFQFGGIKVKLNQSITLQGGGKGNGEETVFYPPTGGETVEAPELKVTGGLGVITKEIQEELEWPQALKDSFKEAKKNKENVVTVKIELAGTKVFEIPGSLDVVNIITEEGPAFTLPLKVRINNAWLATLGGGPCYIGSDAHPVLQHLTTQGAGKALSGPLRFNEGFTNLELHGSTLVDVDWQIEEASTASGCGGAYESYVDGALNKVLNVGPTKRGITVLQGNLHDAASSAVKEAAEKGEL